MEWLPYAFFSPIMVVILIVAYMVFVWPDISNTRYEEELEK